MLLWKGPLKKLKFYIFYYIPKKSKYFSMCIFEEINTSIFQWKEAHFHFASRRSPNMQFHKLNYSFFFSSPLIVMVCVHTTRPKQVTWIVKMRENLQKPTSLTRNCSGSPAAEPCDGLSASNSGMLSWQTASWRDWELHIPLWACPPLLCQQLHLAASPGYWKSTKQLCLPNWVWGKNESIGSIKCSAF